MTDRRKDACSAAEAILRDYEKGRDIDHRGIGSMPEKAELVKILEKLFFVLFAGHFKDRTHHVYDASTELRVTIEDVMYRLDAQIARVLSLDGAMSREDAEGTSGKSWEITCEFFKRLPAIRSLLQTDLMAIYDGDPAAHSCDEIILAYPGFYAIAVFRMAHELNALGVPMIPRILTEQAHSATGIDIHPGATVGRYFFIDHGTGIVIGETTVIGEHVKLYQGVTLGAVSTRGGQKLKGKRRHPTLEDGVTVYAGASVLGDIVIGHDSVIGSNVFITENVPPFTSVSIKNQELRIKERQQL